MILRKETKVFKNITQTIFGFSDALFLQFSLIFIPAYYD